MPSVLPHSLTGFLFLSLKQGQGRLLEFTSTLEWLSSLVVFKKMPGNPVGAAPGGTWQAPQLGSHCRLSALRRVVPGPLGVPQTRVQTKSPGHTDDPEILGIWRVTFVVMAEGQNRAPLSGECA